MENHKPKFDSVILAGGFGRRLSPLTDNIPKPMLPINGKSAFERNLEMLRAQGFMNTAVTTMYLPEQIEAIKPETGYIEYFREKMPLGSAGAVGAIRDNAEDVILVLSGDAVCDFDLAKAKKEFSESKCDAAIILTHRSNSDEYGSVCLKDGRITCICEKPSPRDTLSDMINTGIYFINKKAMEMIPKDEFFDFARDLFPAMLKKDLPIAGIECKGHWFDIGSFGEYHQCNMWVSKGENCIGKQCSIHPNAKIENCVIMDRCTIGDSVLRGCILGEGAVIGNDCIIPAGCVIGSGAELRDNAALGCGSVVGTKEAFASPALIECFPTPKQSLVFDDDYVIAEDSDEGYYVRLGRLLGGEGTVIAFAEGSGTTLPKACEVACGAAEAGSKCTIISGGNAALAAFAAKEYGSRTAFICFCNGHTEIRLFSSNGMPFSREESRLLSSKKPKTSQLAGNVYLLPHGSLMKRYLESLRRKTFFPKKINIADGNENRLLKEIAEESEMTRSKQGAVFSISKDGMQATATLPNGKEISYWQLLAICCIEGERKKICLPKEAPDALEQILKRHSIQVYFYGDSESEERKLAERDELPRDGVLLALTSAYIAEKNGLELEELLERIPPFSVTVRAIFADRDKMYTVIARLREECGNARCAGFDFGEGRVSIYPSASGRFRLIAEAVDSETAEELSMRAIDMLSKHDKRDC